MKTSSEHGKVLTIFLVIIAVLLITLTALSMFFYNVEIDKRKGAEGAIAVIEKDLEQAKIQLKDFQKKNSILAEKNKEAESRVISLMEDLDLEKGLREELKKESVSLKDKLQKLQQSTAKLEDKSATQIGDFEQRVVELEAKLKVELNRNKELQKQNEELVAAQAELKKMAEKPKPAVPQSRSTTSQQRAIRTPPPANRTPSTSANTSKGEQARPSQGEQARRPSRDTSDSAATPRANASRSSSSSAGAQMDIELDQIVVTPDVRVTEEEILRQITDSTTQVSSGSSGSIPDGRILSVDIETAFVVINLGRKHGLTNGLFMAVYRGNDYLGDIKITRTQEEMAAADLVPPLSGQTLRKNDQVIAK